MEKQNTPVMPPMPQMPQMPPMPQMPQMPQGAKTPSLDCNGHPYYTLLDGEEIIFELAIDQAIRSGFDVSSRVVLGKIKNVVLDLSYQLPLVGNILSHFLEDKRQGVFVVTNMRCLVSQITVSGCSHREKQRTFWEFPKSAMNQSAFYEKMYINKGCCCCCCKCIVPTFELGIGLTIGNESESLKLMINETNITSDDQALALCAKIAELGEHASK